ncbi:MAG: hypothetical protein ACM3QU_08255 [Verrucomicrobiota bacterium]
MTARSKSVTPASVLTAVTGLRASAGQTRTLVVSGPPGLVQILVRDVTRGGVSAAVREHGPLEGAAALVHILAGPPGDDDLRLFGEAARRRLPVVAVIPSAADVAGHLPYVLDENVVRVRGGAGFPLEEIAQRLARALGESATPLAARLPVLRAAVCEELIRRFSRRNGVIGAVVFVPGADMPILTLNQIRLVLRIADAHGFEIDRERIPEVLAVIGSAFGFRALARKTIGLVPLVGWAVKGGVAYTGTRAIGEAAVRYFEGRAPVTRVAGERVRFP